ncbi:MAG: NAD+ synthase [Chloroflexi bacterium]|nr:NAD+ synthase [Chloroflexota bacterium]
MTILRVALAQANSTVGDLAGNERKAIGFIQRAQQAAADLVLLPEMFLTGYPPEDLLLKPHFVSANMARLESLARQVRGITAIVGLAHYDGDLYNAAALLHDGQVRGIYHKSYLPNYGVFDEERYFQRGQDLLLFRLHGATIGISICEDIWYPGAPSEDLALAGAQMIVNISASPYHQGKGAARHRMLATRAADNIAAVAFCNLVGGQDELVFDGDSAIFDERGEFLARGRQFEEDLVVADVDLDSVLRRRLHDPRQRRDHLAWPRERIRIVELEGSDSPAKPPLPPCNVQPLDPVAEVYQALVLGTRDYIRKNGFRQVVIAISGGVDSALTACIAADALGPENVTGVFMPSQYSSTDSREDAEALARHLGIKYLSIPITETFAAYRGMLAEALAGTKPDITEENLQARIRGNVLMALSNKFGWLVLTTGNKSEMSVGYCTLYGDMAGGFAVIKDVPKMLVYALSRYRNTVGEAIPQRTLERAPTAELRPNQKDEDSLPPYALLDGILREYVEEGKSAAQIAALGYDPTTVQEVIAMVDRSEYKRRQAPPGVKITHLAFGKDRRQPITNRYRDGSAASGGRSQS